MTSFASRPAALIADDEPLLRESLARALNAIWPELQIVGQARNGREALEMFEALRPDIVFLDVHMPGLNGVEAARQLARRAQIVFVTAFDQYAVQAFEQGALDYLVKPLEEKRLADTVQRLQERLLARSNHSPVDKDAPPAEAARGDALETLEARIDMLMKQLSRSAEAPPAANGGSPPWLQWIRASVGATLKLIPVDEITYLRSDEKYTLVVWGEGEALIRTPIRELMAQLDPQKFVQVHRSVVVNLHAVSHVTRGPNETADVHLRGRAEVLPVSRSYLHLFRQM
ncbi:LytR/AlgR family response regulator transcription factor [Roseateles koreensis]|uniref:LytTR family DNA-binding domain-containing protein n=1 Tax=Roseateles koreensis TaxID=2987526 RepID=A0ABT5KT07_9BURK|nr:LytTR family DNA-binding domain-containing protein [Roseateles koreensis]MDC8786069.1 LytTR family DNA-binding domain-containing protein [Roseateles koreensis]